MTDLEETGDRLRLTRLALGYETQIAFADALGMSPQRWNNYEKGREPLPMPVAEQLCRYGVDFDWLYRAMRDGISSGLRAKIEQIDAAERESPPDSLRK